MEAAQRQHNCKQKCDILCEYVGLLRDHFEFEAIIFNESCDGGMLTTVLHHLRFERCSVTALDMRKPFALKDETFPIFN